jgi:hypothetical protein
MTFSITRTYDRYEDAQAVDTDLKGMGVTEDQISVMAHSEHHDMNDIGTDTTDMDDDSSVGTGATVGTAIGGGAGLLAGLGLMAIPGVGPIVAAGWLAATATGAGIGAVAGAATAGIVDALSDSGMDRRDAETHAEAIRRGGILVSVRAEQADEMRITSVMDRHNPSDLTTRRKSWEESGWTSYDPSSRPYSREERAAELQRWS